MVIQCYQKVILQYNYTTGILLNSMIKALLVYSVHNESVLAIMSVEEVHSSMQPSFDTSLSLHQDLERLAF